MKNAYASYYAHLIQLRRYANKQTLFMAHLLTRMEFDQETKQLKVQLNAAIKRDIMRDINSKSSNLLKTADKYLYDLSQVGSIKSINPGTYIVDPECYGYNTTIPQELRMKSKAIYCSYEFSDEGIKITKGIITKDNKMVESDD